MKSAYQILRRPVITEKAWLSRKTRTRWCSRWRRAATKTEITEAVQSIFKVKVLSVRTANYPGKERRRGSFAGYRPDWKKAYVRLKAGEKDAGVRAESRKSFSSSSRRLFSEAGGDEAWLTS